MATGIIWPEPEVDVQNVVSKPFARPASLSKSLGLVRIVGVRLVLGVVGRW